MTLRAQIKIFALKALLKMDGLPIRDETLHHYIGLGFQPAPPRADITAALKEVEAGGYAAGSTDELDGTVTWTLTTKGEHKAKQLS